MATGSNQDPRKIFCRFCCRNYGACGHQALMATGSNQELPRSREKNTSSKENSRKTQNMAFDTKGDLLVSSFCCLPEAVDIRRRGRNTVDVRRSSRNPREVAKQISKCSRRDIWRSKTEYKPRHEEVSGGPEQAKILDERDIQRGRHMGNRLGESLPGCRHHGGGQKRGPDPL